MTASDSHWIIDKNAKVNMYLRLILKGLYSFLSLFSLWCKLRQGSPVVFRKICLLKREWDPVFDIIISLIFPENLIEISQVVQKIWRISLTIIDIFIYFHRFFGLFDIPLLQRNWWRQFITDYVSIFLLPTYFK